jgi:SET domain-containing protein
MIANSKIDGKGVFATGNIEEGEVIAPARINGKRTPIGRYTNHSKNINAIMLLRDNGNIDLVAKKAINGCQGGNLGEEITIDYRQALSLATRRD